MVRLAAFDEASNVAVIKVVCDTHARRVIVDSHGVKFRASTIDDTERSCSYCENDVEQSKVDGWP